MAGRMDPSTVITLLSLNLISIGALLFLIARHMPDPAGLRGFGSGALVFGLAYLMRLWMGVSSGSAVGIASDAGMVYAILCFATGLRQFSGQRPIGRRRILAAVVVYTLVSTLATVGWQGVGRHAVLNVALGLGYGLLAALAVAAARRETAALRRPLWLLAVLVGLLGLATLARGAAVVRLGLGPLFAGPAAQAYYAYSILVTVLLGPNLLWMVFLRLNQRLADLATRDALTRLLNRNGLEDALQRSFGMRPAPSMAVLLVDVDHFKRINDQHGHAGGDAVLRSVAQALAAQVRAGDCVARWGGEEFLVVGQAADGPLAHALAERLRRAVQATAHGLPGGGSLHCTVSVGVAGPIADRAAWEATLRAADEALYAAKHAGRNRVVMATRPSPDGAGAGLRASSAATVPV